MFISGLSYITGALEPIDRLPELKAAPDLLTTFLGQGLQNYSRIDVTQFVPLLEECIRRTLSTSGVSESDVDGLVVASSTMLERFDMPVLGRIFKTFNFPHAPLYGVSLAECANFVSALKFAQLLVQSRTVKNILVVVLDLIPERRSRVVPPAISIYSDAICSLLVRAEGEAPLQVMHVDSHADNRLWTIGQANLPAYMEAFTRGTHEFVNRFFKAAGLKPQSIQACITSNYNRSISVLYSHLTSIPLEKMFLENISRVGHTYACDNLINLKDYCDSRPLQGPEKVFMLATGLGLWGAIMVTRT